jgi:hypothetical protein
VNTRAVAWLAAAEDGNLPAANIEATRDDTIGLKMELEEAARSLATTVPHDRRALIDLLMYMEKHFSLLPHEVNVLQLREDGVTAPRAPCAYRGYSSCGNRALRRSPRSTSISASSFFSFSYSPISLSTCLEMNAALLSGGIPR